MLLTAILSPVEEGGYIALNPETGTTTQGETVDEAIANLKTAIEKDGVLKAYAKDDCEFLKLRADGGFTALVN